MPCPNSARERSVTIGFCVTPEQARRIDLMARTSGTTKQDYLYSRALEEEVVVRPDARAYKTLQDEMARVYRELRRIRSAGEVDEGLAWTIDFLARDFSTMRGGEEPSDVEREDALIFGMSRRGGRREAMKRCSPRQENGGTLSLTKKHIVLLSLRGACVPGRFLY